MTQPVAAIDLMSGVARLAGLAVFAALLAAVIAVVYRWYAGDRVPTGLVVLVGLAGVAVYLNTTTALGQVIGGARGLLDLETALLNTATFAIAALSTVAGGRVGDRVAREAVVVSGVREIDTDVSRLVRAVGRVITVTLPAADDIEELEGYDPVPPGTKEALAGKTLLFPKGLTVAELGDRLITRLKEDHGVGHVGVDLAADGTVEYLAVGSRASGIGPTIAPGAGAVAIRADPPFAASSGDVVQVWTAGDDPERVATAELRAAVDDVVTLVLDEAEAEAFDPTARYRLMTMPAAARPEQEFASLLRSADETMGVVTVAEGSDLAGTPLGGLDVTVVAVRPADGTVEAIPPRSHVLEAGDTVYVIARPEAIRRLEATTRAPAAEAESSS